MVSLSRFQENKQLKDALDEAKIMRKALEQVPADNRFILQGWRSFGMWPCQAQFVVQPPSRQACATCQAMDELKRKFEELHRTMKQTTMLLGAKRIATRSKDATRGSWPYY